tara:strand:+ start:109 stop:666 length:558 start_codon:yes stop_codon:yes gene_type:complete
MYFLARRMQPFRWAEYAFTSSIMLWCLFSLSRLTEIYLLTAMFFLSVFLELCGGLAFEVLTFVLDRHVKRGKERRLINVLRWVLYALSWGVFILSYVAIWDAFLSIVNPYMSLENGDLWGQLFSFVGILNGVILAAYCSFPLLHLWQVLRPEQYVTVELGYIVASWVSKTILTVTIFIAAVQRKD